MEKIPVVLCGLGTVGSGVVRLLQNNRENIKERLGAELQLVQVGARRPNPSCDLGSITRTEDVLAPAEHEEARILIELLGGTDVAYELTRRALTAGKSVITANKALLAAKGDELVQLARENKVRYVYEAAVAGGVPIIKVIKEGLAAAEIVRLTGIINGTANYILSQMTEEGVSFADALKEAQARGYAEADPKFDVNGNDSSHKLAILAALAFAIPLTNTRIFCEGITQLATQELEYAHQLGYVVKHLAIAERFADERINLRVRPTLVHQTHELARVSGVTNAVMIDSIPLGATFYGGPGAGGDATASAVVADLMDLVRCPLWEDRDLPPPRKVPYVPLADIVTEFYLRVNVRDEAGVMAEITRILSDANISIEALHQQEHSPADPQAVPIIVLTHRVAEKNLRRAIDKIARLAAVTAKLVCLPVLGTSPE